MPGSLYLRRKQYGIVLDIEQHERIRHQAEREGKPISDVIGWAMHKYLEANHPLPCEECQHATKRALDKHCGPRQPPMLIP